MNETSSMTEKRSVTAGAGTLDASFSFCAACGITLDSLTGSAAGRAVAYVPAPTPFMPFASDGEWRFESCRSYDAEYGLRPVRRAELTVSDSTRRVTLNVVSFPESPVLRYWFTVENTDAQNALSLTLMPSALRLSIDRAKSIYTAFWYTGGRARYDFGSEHQAGMGSHAADVAIRSNMTADYVPLYILHRQDEPNDGLAVQLDYAGPWTLDIRRRGRVIGCDFAIDPDAPTVIPPTEKRDTPVVTVAAFAGDRDELMTVLYDWQYRYMWDYTNPEYFAKTRDSARFWVFCSRNLHEQFGHRLTVKGLELDAFRDAGFDILWEDAGWAASPDWPEDVYWSVGRTNYESPDHRLISRYFEKCGMKWLIWFMGKPSLGVLDTKQGAWGLYEYRTDGLENRNLDEEQTFKRRILDFLDADIRRSFHTCSGGSTYCLTFDMQRYANFHYAADSGVGPYNNYYYSYFFLPDRWADSLLMLGAMQVGNDGSSDCMEPADPDECAYSPEFARSRLTNVPIPGSSSRNDPREVEAIRRDLEIYRYLKEKGVAGQWSYMFHPDVAGDSAIYYMQRTSRDRSRACIILRHRPRRRVIVFPHGLNADETYTVTFENSAERFTATGGELADSGIRIGHCTDGELIYLNLTDAPWHAAPVEMAAPPRVLIRPEINVETAGTGVYWCPANETAPISGYQVARNGQIIARVSRGHYYFDRDVAARNAGAVYAVRTVGVSGGVSAWTEAQSLPGAPLVFSALGDHGEDFGAKGWRAETSEDLVRFTPMTWVAPERDPSADLGGTPNQRGGSEGYWAGGLCAKIGRGWCQASPDTCCVRSFTVPVPGHITLTGRAMKEWYHSAYGSDVDVCVMHNGTVVFPWHTLRRGDIDGVSYAIGLDVQAGDVLRFVTGKCDPAHNDPIHWEHDANLIGWITAITYDGAAPEKGFCVRKEVNGRGDRIGCVLPVPADVYAIRLTFTEKEYQWSGERSMTVRINGHVTDADVDIVHDTRRNGQPLVRVYEYAVPDADGNINVTVTSNRGGCTLDRVEAAARHDETVRINCGGEAYIDWSGAVWEADRYATGGTPVVTERYDLMQAAPTPYDKKLYFTGRSGTDFGYRVPVASGICSVHLKFAELDSLEPKPFDVWINGEPVCTGRDALTAAGEFPMTADMRFDGVFAPDGYVSIRIRAASPAPVVLRGIEID